MADAITEVNIPREGEIVVPDGLPKVDTEYFEGQNWSLFHIPDSMLTLEETATDFENEYAPDAEKHYNDLKALFPELAEPTLYFLTDNESHARMIMLSDGEVPTIAEARNQLQDLIDSPTEDYIPTFPAVYDVPSHAVVLPIGTNAAQSLRSSQNVATPGADHQHFEVIRLTQFVNALFKGSRRESLTLSEDLKDARYLDFIRAHDGKTYVTIASDKIDHKAMRSLRMFNIQPIDTMPAFTGEGSMAEFLQDYLGITDKDEQLEFVKEKLWGKVSCNDHQRQTRFTLESVNTMFLPDDEDTPEAILNGYDQKTGVKAGGLLIRSKTYPNQLDLRIGFMSHPDLKEQLEKEYAEREEEFEILCCLDGAFKIVIPDATTHHGKYLLNRDMEVKFDYEMQRLFAWPETTLTPEQAAEHTETLMRLAKKVEAVPRYGWDNYYLSYSDHLNSTNAAEN